VDGRVTALAVASLSWAAAGASTWSLVPVPVPAGAVGGILYSTSCVTTSSCIGVGEYYEASASQLPMAEDWDGSAWSVQSLPASSQASGGGLLGVSCVSADWCMAVGTQTSSASPYFATLAEVWNGSGWAVLPSPSPGGDAKLYSVSCVDASLCFASGWGYVGGIESPLVQQWDGSSWSVVSVPSPAGTSLAELYGISCSSASACTTVGTVVDSVGEVPLVERWDGSSWSLETAPIPTGAAAAMEGVACVSVSACTGVGTYNVGSGPGMSLADGWDGSSWSLEASQNPGSAANALVGVSCVAASACIAVGAEASGSDPEMTLAEVWDGTGWSVQSTPQPSEMQSDLYSDSCLAVSWCQSVGLFRPTGGGTLQPLSEMYTAASTPSVSTLASGGVPLGGQVSATATVSGGQSPSGSVTFRLFGPNDASCSSVPVFTSTVPVSGDGSYDSGSFTPAIGETYRWTATYSGDQSNNPASSACGAKGGTVIVSRLNTTLDTTASGTVAAGGQVSDTATLSGGLSPSRWIRFRLYGPGDTTCSGAQVFTSRIPVSGDGSYPSTATTLTAAGTYRWTAEYPGDLNNNAASEGCGRDRRGRDRNQGHPRARHDRVGVGAARAKGV